MSIIAARFLDDVYEMGKDCKLAPLRKWRIYLHNSKTKDTREVAEMETRAEYPDLMPYVRAMIMVPWGYSLTAEIIQ